MQREVDALYIKEREEKRRQKRERKKQKEKKKIVNNSLPPQISAEIFFKIQQYLIESISQLVTDKKHINITMAIYFIIRPL